jgi:hypothetical protein
MFPLSTCKRARSELAVLISIRSLRCTSFAKNGRASFRFYVIVPYVMSLCDVEQLPDPTADFGIYFIYVYVDVCSISVQKGFFWFSLVDKSLIDESW